jgi:mannose-6-phosphate isomerase-like protein (cupin superfamily)
MQASVREAIVVPPSGGAEWNVLGSKMTCKVGSEETGGVYSIVENTLAPQDGPPPHVHHNEDEIFYVIEGEFEIRCGERTFRAAPGALAVLPRNVPHSFRNVGEGEGRLLVTVTPGGFEKFFEEVSRELPTMPPDVAKLKEIGRKYNLEFIV